MTPAVETAAPDRMARREPSKPAVAGAPISPAPAFIAHRPPYTPPDREMWTTAPLPGRYIFNSTASVTVQPKVVAAPAARTTGQVELIDTRAKLDARGIRK